jgi:hypothetical protein
MGEAIVVLWRRVAEGARGYDMKNAVLAALVLLLFAAPASAQMRRYSTATRNPTIVRTPPSSALGAAGISAPTTSSYKPMYPKAITKYHDPRSYDPTFRNQNLRRRGE